MAMVIVVCSGCALRTSSVAPGPADATLEVTALNLFGVEAVSGEALRGVIRMQPGPWWPWAEPQLFDPEVLQADLQRIVDFYDANGYPDARIASHGVDTEDGEVRITISIHEGEPVRVAALDVVGLEPLAESERVEIRERMLLAAGEPLAIAEVAASAELIAQVFADHGYPYAEVQVHRQQLSPTEVRLTFDAVPGPPAWFGEIEITGNVSVDDAIIRRELLYRPGEPYERRLLQESHRKLYQLGIFRFANIERLEDEQRPTYVRTRVTVVEGDHHRVEGSLGYGTEEKFRADGSWRNVNFLGDARTLGVRGSWSSLTRGAELDFVQPYLWHPRLSLRVDAHGLHENEASYDLTARGGMASLIARVDAHTTAQLTVLSEAQTSVVSPFVLDDPTLRDELIAMGLDPETGRQGGWLNSLALGLTRDTSDQRLNPQRGYMVSGSLEHAGGWLPGVFDFFEWDVAGRHYLPLGERVVIASRLRVATIDPAGTSEELPFAHRYFLGGSTSLRGWGRFEVSPLSAGGLPLGGKSLLDSSLEVRGLVHGDFGVVGFVDAGNVWWSEWKFDLNDLRADIGAGLRYHTPVGPLRLDAAWQLTPIPNLFIEGQRQARRWRIHFSIGQAF